MTLAVGTLGEGVKARHILSNSLVYIVTSALSGALFGLIISLSVYLVMIWTTIVVKLLILLIIVFVYLIKQIGLINLRTPQCSWQIPPTWVNHSSVTNMIVWGFFLGGGIFTYNPYVLFWIKYVYIGFFHHPIIGFWIGMVYGIARAFPSIILAIITYTTSEQKRANLINQIWNKGRSFQLCHSVLLTIIFVYLIIGLFQTV